MKKNNLFELSHKAWTHTVNWFGFEMQKKKTEHEIKHKRIDTIFV